MYEHYIFDCILCSAKHLGIACNFKLCYKLNNLKQTNF